MDNCSFVPVTVGSLHRNKVPCRVVCAGQSASLSLEGPQLYLRKGMKLMSVEARPRACFYFQVMGIFFMFFFLNSLFFSFCVYLPFLYSVFIFYFPIFIFLLSFFLQVPGIFFIFFSLSLFLTSLFSLFISFYFSTLFFCSFLFSLNIHPASSSK